MIAELADVKDPSLSLNTYLMRDLEYDSETNWKSAACLKGQGHASYVNHKEHMDRDQRQVIPS